MVIQIEKLKNVLTHVILGELSRESVAYWAWTLREAADRENLIYDPIEDEDKIWEVILFLEGIDLQYEPSNYLHSEMDMKLFLNYVTSNIS